MFTHNLNPILFDLGFLSIRWYSLAYIFGILIGWWYGKKILKNNFQIKGEKFKLEEFDDLITYLIISIILGGRIGYVLFYNLEYYIYNLMDIFKVWEGGMSFHGALIGIIIGTYFFSKKRKIKIFLVLDIIAAVAPIGIFLGRIANFINSELTGRATEVYWGVVFPKIDNISRHPSQLYEALLEGLVLFFIMKFLLSRKKYKVGDCSFLFLIFYGIFRIFTEFFRQPDAQLGYILGFMSMGMLLSLIMIFAGVILYLKKNDF